VMLITPLRARGSLGRYSERAGLPLANDRRLRVRSQVAPSVGHEALLGGVRLRLDRWRRNALEAAAIVRMVLVRIAGSEIERMCAPRREDAGMLFRVPLLKGLMVITVRFAVSLSSARAQRSCRSL
jgi:hypothetical protein